MSEVIISSLCLIIIMLIALVKADRLAKRVNNTGRFRRLHERLDEQNRRLTRLELQQHVSETDQATP